MELQTRLRAKKFVASSAVVEASGQRWNILAAAKRTEKSFVNTRAYDGRNILLRAIQWPTHNLRPKIEAPTLPTVETASFETFTVRTVRTTPAPVECLPINISFESRAKVRNRWIGKIRP